MAKVITGLFPSLSKHGQVLELFSITLAWKEQECLVGKLVWSIASLENMESPSPVRMLARIIFTRKSQCCSAGFFLALKGGQVLIKTYCDLGTLHDRYGN